MSHELYDASCTNSLIRVLQTHHQTHKRALQLKNLSPCHMSYEWVTNSTYKWVTNFTDWVMLRVNVSCHMWMSHVTRQWVVSMSCVTCACILKHTTEFTIERCSSKIWAIRVTCPCTMSHVNESCHMSMNHVTREWVMSHVNDSCHTWMSHVTREWVVSHVNKSCHTSMSHVTREWDMSHVNETCRAYKFPDTPPGSLWNMSKILIFTSFHILKPCLQFLRELHRYNCNSLQHTATHCSKLHRYSV